MIDTTTSTTTGSPAPHQDAAPHISTDDARGGSTPHIVRYILGVSLFLAAAAMSLVWIIPALTH